MMERVGVIVNLRHEQANQFLFCGSIQKVVAAAPPQLKLPDRLRRVFGFFIRFIIIVIGVFIVRCLRLVPSSSPSSGSLSRDDSRNRVQTNHHDVDTALNRPFPCPIYGHPQVHRR